MIKSIGWDTSFHLNGKFPLLDNSIFPSLKAAKSFVEDSTSSAIAGTIIGVDDPSNANESGIYEIFNNSGELALRKIVNEGTLSSYQTKIDSLINDLSGNYDSELGKLAAQQTEILKALRDGIFSPDTETSSITRTMMLQVGADSTNYRFSTSEIGGKDTEGIRFDSSNGSLQFLNGTLYHFSITDNSGFPKTWNVPNDAQIESKNGSISSLGSTINLSDYIKGEESLWVYIKVPKVGNEGIWFLSPTKYGCILDSTQSPSDGISLGDPNYYYLLYGYCGILHKVTPFFESIYGNTWIKGSTIYTGKIQTMDGQSVLDLDNNTLKLGNDFYYADGQVVVGNPDTGAFVFHKHGDDTALHVGTMTKDSDGSESWNGMTFANGELTIGKYEEKLKEMQTQLDKEVSTWYGNGIPLPYKENNESTTVDSVTPELASSYNETLTTDENGVKMFNLSPDPEPLPRHINDIYINSITGVGYRLVVSNWGTETQEVYWLQLSQWDLQNILDQLNNVNSEVGNIKKALDITEDGQTTIGDKFIQTMMLRIGADSTNYTLSETSTSGNRMQNLLWIEHDNNIILGAKQGEILHHSIYYWINDNKEKSYDWRTPTTREPIFTFANTETNPYYLYIKCPKNSYAAVWVASDTPKTLQDDSYYYFPFGTVVNPSTKTLVEVRGNTKIVGDRIITGKLESNSGNSFFDLDTGKFALGLDQNNPGNLDKAAFSFDGSKVHIGGQHPILNYKDTIVDQNEGISMSVSWIGDSLGTLNVQMGKVPALRKLLFKNITSGHYTISFQNFSNSFSSNSEYYSCTETAFGNNYVLAIGAYADDVDPEESGINFDSSGKITNKLINVTIINDIGFCEVDIDTPSNIYLILGNKENNGNPYNFQSVEKIPPQGIISAPMYQAEYSIHLVKLIETIPEVADLTLRESLEINGSTDISGGLVLTNCLGVKNSEGVVTAGISGINDENNKTAFWAGSTIDDKENATVKITSDGIGSKIGPLMVKDSNSVTINGEGPDLQFINSESGKSKTLLLSGKYLEKDDTDAITGSTNYFKLPISSLYETKYKKYKDSSQDTFTLFNQSISINNKTPSEYYTNTFSGTITPSVFNGLKISFAKSSFNAPWNGTISIYYTLKLVVSNGSSIQTIITPQNTHMEYECNSADSDATYIMPIVYDQVSLDENVLKPGIINVQLLFSIKKFYRKYGALSWSYLAGNSLYNSLDITITRPSIDLGALLSITRTSKVNENTTVLEQRSEIGMNGFRFKYGDALFNARIINYQEPSLTSAYKYGNQLIINLSGLPVISGTGLTAGALIVKDGILYIAGDETKGVKNTEIPYSEIENGVFGDNGPATPIE